MNAYSCISCDKRPDMLHCQPCGNTVEVITEQVKMYIPEDFVTNEKSGFVKFRFNIKKYEKPTNIEVLEFEPSNLPKGYFIQLIRNSTFTLEGAENCVANKKFEATFKFPIK